MTSTPTGMPLIFSTHNAHKLAEVKAILNPAVSLRSLTDEGIIDDIEETGSTFEENSFIKARFIFDRTGADCFSDDSGLIVDALNGEPGIFSARYSGSRDMQANLDLVLHRMQGIQNRAARFVTVICLIFKGQPHYFRGVIEGIIQTEQGGSGGFGYDPIFQPLGYTQNFAQMPEELKNKLSHRAQAVQQLNSFLELQGFSPA